MCVGDASVRVVCVVCRATCSWDECEEEGVGPGLNLHGNMEYAYVRLFE